MSLQDLRHEQPAHPRMSRKDSRRQGIVNWIDKLPKVPSHYCRSSSKKTHVEQTFTSLSNMHALYTEDITANKEKPMCYQTFVDVLHEMKVSIHYPRKDQCDTCFEFKAGAISQEDYDIHIIKKCEARNAKKTAKESASDRKLVVTMDLRSVLLTPKILASSAYYQQKLQVHNFTLYSVNNSEVQLYVWHEGNEGVSCNEFTTCIADYICDQALSFNHAVLISDGCTY